MHVQNAFEWELKKESPASRRVVRLRVSVRAQADAVSCDGAQGHADGRPLRYRFVLLSKFKPLISPPEKLV